VAPKNATAAERRIYDQVYIVWDKKGATKFAAVQEVPIGWYIYKAPDDAPAPGGQGAPK
jgi:hypothetical protein